MSLEEMFSIFRQSWDEHDKVGIYTVLILFTNYMY